MLQTKAFGGGGDTGVVGEDFAPRWVDVGRGWVLGRRVGTVPRHFGVPLAGAIRGENVRKWLFVKKNNLPGAPGGSALWVRESA